MQGTRSIRLLAALAAALACGCSGLGGGPREPEYGFFAPAGPADDDIWFEKVGDWQAREVRDSADHELANAEQIREAGIHSGLLRVTMGRFRASERMVFARRLVEWAQGETRRVYRFDPPTSQSEDPWPTTKDLLDANGDDCDGLDLIAYHLLLDFGFPPDQLYRAIVRRDADWANHMVTLWFEDPHDPWVIDAVGAVTQKVRRFSDLPGWTPTKIFNERQQFTPVPRRSQVASSSEAEPSASD